MVALLLTAALLLHTHTLVWTPSQTGGEADGYRIYWSYFSDEWYRSDMIEVPASQLEIPLDVVPEPAYPGDLIFMNITAFNEAGESYEEHGSVLP